MEGGEAMVKIRRYCCEVLGVIGDEGVVGAVGAIGDRGTISDGVS